MKIQMDTTRKTIKIEEDVKLSLLISTLKKLLPNNEWKSFTLQTNTVISYWHNPIYIKTYPKYPEYPWYEPYTTWFSSDSPKNQNYSTAEYKLQSGVYNVEV